METAYEQIADGLAETGYAVVENFLSPQEVQSLLAIIRQDEEEDRLRKAGIGALNQFQVDKGIRGDFIRWIQPETAAPATQLALEKAHGLMVYLNRTLYLGLRDLEAHFAKYPEGTFYKRHVDRFQRSSARTISMIMYLNEDWKPKYGGQLVMYLRRPDGGEDRIVVEPSAGTLACFRSDTVPHEVLTAHRARYSLTGWFLNQPADIPFVKP